MILWAVVVVAGWVGIMQSPAVPTPGSANDPALRVLTQFLNAVQSGSLDDVLPHIDVPWFMDGKLVITDPEELKNEFHGLLTRRKGKPRATCTVKRDLPYGEVRTRFEDVERRMLDRVLVETDRMFLVAIDNGKDPRPETVVVFVRVRDGQARVVGIKN